VESGYLPVTTAANDMDAIRASGLELTDDYFEAWYQAHPCAVTAVRGLTARKKTERRQGDV